MSLCKIENEGSLTLIFVIFVGHYKTQTISYTFRDIEIPSMEQTKETSSINSNTSTEKMCRICHGGEDEGKLISPCKCKGSMKYVRI